MVINKYEEYGNGTIPFAKRRLIELDKWWNFSLTAYYSGKGDIQYYSLIMFKRKWLIFRLGWKVANCKVKYNPESFQWEDINKG